MYKVFIDHKPIIFVNDAEFSKNMAFIKAIEIINFLDDISVKLEEVDLNNPLQIVCQNTEVEFEKFQLNFRLIQAAGGIVYNEAYGYLTIMRNGLWDLPKGKMESGEIPEETAVREIEEECGIIAPTIEKQITITYHIYEHKGKRILKKTFWYFMRYDGPKKVKPQLEEGITVVQWKSKDDLFAIRENTYGSINEVLKAFKERILNS